MRALPRRSRLAVLTALCVACDVPTRAVPTPAAVEIVSGDAQVGLGLDPLPAPLVIRVTDRGGAAVHGARVTWSTTQGAVYRSSPRTDEDGIASAQWELLPFGSAPPSFGEKTATVTVSGLATPTTFTAVLAHPQRLRAFAFTPDSASTAAAAVAVAVQVEAYTMYRGIRRVEVRFAHDSSAQVLTIELARSTGSALDGVWQGTLPVPQGSSGTWTPSVFVTTVDPDCDCDGFPQLTFRDFEGLGTPPRLVLTGG